jgi:hypothetical protein
MRICYDSARSREALRQSAISRPLNSNDTAALDSVHLFRRRVNNPATCCGVVDFSATAEPRDRRHCPALLYPRQACHHRRSRIINRHQRVTPREVPVPTIRERRTAGSTFSRRFIINKYLYRYPGGSNHQLFSFVYDQGRIKLDHRSARL